MSIEERAHQFGIKRAGGWYEKGTKGMIYQGSKDMYIDIATEQEKITKQEMIEKFKTFLSDLSSYIVEDFIPYGNGDKVLTMNYDELIKDFEKTIK